MARLTAWLLLTTSLSVLGTASRAQSPLTISKSVVGAQSQPQALDASGNGIETSASSTQPPTETGRLIPGISSYAFSPYPSPTQAPKAGVFVPTDPTTPPPVHSDPAVLPDFGAAWAAAYTKATAKISNFTLDEKASVATGTGWQVGRCVGNIPAIADWGGLCLEVRPFTAKADSPLGVRFADFATLFPAGINAAATWNRKLIRARGLAMGREHRGKGVHVALGPMMNTLRVPAGGRNWEGFGADPFLSGEAAYETVLGMQAFRRVLSTTSTSEDSAPSSGRHVLTLDLHEIYLHPFLRSVMAGVASVMCSYSEPPPAPLSPRADRADLVNDTYACENDKMLNDVLKRELGFQGYVMSDWAATMSTISAAQGLDMTMPGDVTMGSGGSYFGGNLTAYVRNGTIPAARVDDMATRVLAGWYLLRQDRAAYPATNFDAFAPLDGARNAHVDVQGAHARLVREIGAASTVLLKNEGGALPLKKPRSLVIVGNDAGPGRAGPNQFTDQGGSDGTLASGWGSGSANFTYLITPYEAIQARARRDRTSVSWLFDNYDLPLAASMAAQRSAALVFVNADSGEGYITVDGNAGDRRNLTAWHGGDALVLAVAAANNNTVVVVHSVGALILEAWIEHPNVTAVLWAGLPGPETGNAITDVLYGDWNPSGRLPYTIAQRAADYPASLVLGGSPDEILKIDYSEGLLVDYRWFDSRGIAPRFEFGFGLSYTTFAYANLEIHRVDRPSADPALAANWDAGGSSPIAEGSSTALWLHEPAYRITFEVENTGTVYGGDIPQLYVNFPETSGEPPAVLKGFTHVELDPADTASVTIALSRYDLSIWNVVDQGWQKPAGTIQVTIGASSRDGRLKGTVIG
ncbi:hypothetical protein HWV62_8124 [Athelia sp. TMB]|nr:hypothetical protein HWV62_8124 [Athelia sp. TMB]